MNSAKLCSVALTHCLISEKDSNGNATSFAEWPKQYPLEKNYHGNQTAKLPCFFITC